MSRFALIKAVLGPIMRLMFRPRVEGAEHIPGDGPVILAGNHVTFIDSLGLSALVAGYQAAGRVGARFTVANPAPFVYRQLAISGLADLFGCRPPEEGSGRAGSALAVP